MTSSRALKGLLVGAVAAGALAATSATAASYVVCNQYDVCWKVKEKYTFYPADQRVAWHDEAWWEAHQHDAHMRWMQDRDSDRGWYDKDGDWRPYADATPPPP